MKLYVYDHCPFCLKARMIFGLKQVPVTVETLLNDDSDTPTRLVGKKMVPILEQDDGTAMGESMDIVRTIDDRYPMPEGRRQRCLAGPTRSEISAWAKEVMPLVMRLTMPRWVKAPLAEFATASARDHFQHKKEEMLGETFADAYAQSTALLAELKPQLATLAALIRSSQAVNGELSEDDFTLFPILRQLTIVKGIRFPATVDAYLQEMAACTAIPLHSDIAI